MDLEDIKNAVEEMISDYERQDNVRAARKAYIYKEVLTLLNTIED